MENNMIEQEEPLVEGIIISTRDQIQDAKLAWKSMGPEVDKVTKQAAFDKIQALWQLQVNEMGELKCRR
jgi:hypothetical protein